MPDKVKQAMIQVSKRIYNQETCYTLAPFEPVFVSCRFVDNELSIDDNGQQRMMGMILKAEGEDRLRPARTWQPLSTLKNWIRGEIQMFAPADTVVLLQNGSILRDAKTVKPFRKSQDLHTDIERLDEGPQVYGVIVSLDMETSIYVRSTVTS